MMQTRQDSQTLTTSLRIILLAYHIPVTFDLCMANGLLLSRIKIIQHLNTEVWTTQFFLPGNDGLKVTSWHLI